MSNDDERKRKPKNSGEKRRNESSCHSRSSSRRRRGRESYQSPSEIIIKILSASYGPCECNSFNDSEESPVPSTRDCTSFLLDLLLASQRREELRLQNDEEESDHSRRKEQQERDRCNNIVRVPPTVDGKIQSFVYLLPGVGTGSGDSSHPSPSESSNGRGFVSMNAVFGDPCPGKTKRLEVKYTVTEVFEKGEGFRTSSPSPLPYVPTEIHRVSFAEHEAVKLRRYLTTVNTMRTVGEEGDDDEKDAPDENGRDVHRSHSREHTKAWKLQPATSEIALPIILPFLDLWERMQCRSICHCWKNIVQKCGVSNTIDVNDTEIISSRRSAAVTSSNSNSFSRSMLRGLLAYSYSSLQSLFLNGFGELQKEDLHPALPSLRNLRVLDISHCSCLDDSTLQLLAKPDMPCSTTLRVLYLKGLCKITDIGLIAICSSCSRLEVLDLSHLNNITDEGGRYIQRLIFLRALFLRDNWKLTNESVDGITSTCSKLEQLTLWGSVRLKHLKFDSCKTTTSNRLVILNLWGCHSLDDDVAHVLSSIPNLSCLIVSECHRLSDRFVQMLVERIAQQKRGKRGLRHLHLRYLKKITDAAIIAIALKLSDLLSLDLTFCSKVTAIGIYRLLDELRNSLMELRLGSCRSLQIGMQTPEGEGQRRMHGRQSNSENRNHAGHWILNGLRRRPHSKTDHSLCLLDVRGCGGQPGKNIPYDNEDSFVKGMSALQFEQKVPGFFSRSL